MKKIKNMIIKYHSNLETEELRGGKWRFRLKDNIIFYSDRKLTLSEKTISFRDSLGNEWAAIIDCLIKINKGYCWNGASPKKWIPILGWIGTPDFKSTRAATCLHDMFYQFMRTHHFPFEVKECDAMFRDVMKINNFKLKNTYHGAVRDFGSLFLGDKPKNGEYSVMV